MSNVLATCSIIAKESLAVLENMLGFSQNVNRDWEPEFAGNQARGYSPGVTINIKKPPRYTYRAGAVSVPQSTTETTVPLTLSQGGCDLSFTSAERTLSLTKLEDKLQAAMAPVANEIDRQGLALAHYSTYNAIGTAGTYPTTQALAFAAVAGVNQRLDEMAAPRDKRRALIMNAGMNGAMIQGFGGLFNNASKIGKQYDSGMMVDSLGLAYAMDQNVDIHTNGTQAVAAAANAVDGANQTGPNLTVDAGVLTGTITRGSVIQIGGVYAVNPQSRVSTGTLMDFVVTEAFAGGAATLKISPTMVATGAFQNVSNLPADNATIAIKGVASGSYACNVGYHKDAFTLAMVPMWAPPGGKGVIDVAQETHKGFTIKVTEFYDGTNDKSIHRLDVLFGWAAPYPELSVKLIA